MQRKLVNLDDQAQQDVALIKKTYSLRSLAAVVRYALRELARRIQQAEEQDA